MADDVIRKMAVELAMENSSFESGKRKLQTDLKVIDSEFKAAGAAVKGWGSSLDGLKANAEALGQKISVQRQVVELYNAQIEKTRQSQDRSISTMEKLKSKLDAAKTAYEQSAATLGKTDDKTKALGETVAELDQKYKSAESAVRRNETSIQGYTVKVNEATGEIRKMEAEIVRVNNAKLENLVKQLDDVGSKLESAGKKALLLSAAIVGGVGLAGKAAIDYQTAFTGVEKTVDASKQQLEQISSEIRQMALDMPAATKEIAAVAEAAGQLGIKADNITNFTKVMIDLGETTDLTADQAATSLAQMSNVTQMAAEDYDNLGAAIVALGNNGASTESQIVNMATKIAATGELVSLTEPQILALASTLSSLGIEAEAGGTAASKLLKEFEVLTSTGSEKLADFAKVAGMSAGEFTAAWGKDPILAVSAFISGLGKLDKQGGSSVATLEKLGVTEVRMSNAILAMASSGDLLTNNLKISNTAWEENTALQTEAEKRYATTASQLQIAKNTINDVAITMGEEFLPMINNAAKGVKNLGEWVSNLNEDQKENIIRVLAITAALGPMLLIVGKTVTAIKGATAAIVAYRAAAAAGATSTAALSAAMSATPVGLITTAIALLGSVIVGSLITSAISGKDAVDELSASLKDLETNYANATKTIKETAESQLSNIAAAEDLIGTFDKLNEKLDKTSAEKKQLTTYAEKINSLFGEQVYRLNETTGAYESTVGSVDDYIAALIRQVEAQALIDQLTAETIRRNDAQDVFDTAKEQYDLLADQIDAQQAVVDAYEKQSEDIYSATADLAAQWEAALDDLDALKIEQDSYNKTMQQSQTNIDEAKAASDKLTDQLKENAEAADENAGATEHNARTMSEASGVFKKHQEATKKLTDKTDLYNAAIKEQNERGTLSLETYEKLIDAGYGHILEKDEETGAITVNEAAYKNLTAAQYETLIAEMKLERSNLANKMAVIKAAMDEVAHSSYDAAIALYQTAEAIEDQVDKYDVQIAELEAAQASIGSYSAAVRSSGGAVKEETERMSDAFQDLQEDLDKSYDRGEIDLKDYLAESERLRDEYLKNNKEAWVDAYEDVRDKVADIQGDMLQEIVDDFNDARDDLLGQQEDLRSKLSEMAELTLTEKVGDTEVTKLANLSEVKAKLQKYQTVVLGLKGKIPQSMMAYILGLSPDEAIAAAELLSNLSPEELLKQSQDWTDIQNLSEQIAAETYAPQFDELEKSLLDSVTGFTDTMTAAGFELGGDTAANIVAGVVEGIRTGTFSVESAIAQMMAAAQAAADMADDAHSPSKKYIAKGLRGATSYAMGWTQGGKAIDDAVTEVLNAASAQARSLSIRASSAISSLTGQVAANAGQVNPGGSVTGAADYTAMADVIASRVSTAIAGTVPAGGRGDLILPVSLNGREIARVLLPDFRQADRESPERKDDY